MKYNNKKSCHASSIFSTTDDVLCSDKSYFLKKHSSIPCTSTSTCHYEPKTNNIHIPIYYQNNYWYKVKC